MSDLDNLFGIPNPPVAPVEPTVKPTEASELKVTPEEAAVFEVVEVSVEDPKVEYHRALVADVETARDGRRIEDIPAQDDEPFHVATRRLQAFHNQMKDK